VNPVPNPAAFAALLCDWCVGAQPGDQVLVRFTPESLALGRAVHSALLERGAWPLMGFSHGVFARDFYLHARPEQLDAHAPLALAEAQDADALIQIDAPANTMALAGVDPAVIARVARGRRPVSEAQLKLRWCGTLWPSSALAQQARMNDDDYAAFVERALFLDRPDPVAAWRALSEQQTRLVDRLTPVHEIRIEAPGTDLTLHVDGRTWINSDGRHNMPSGEVFTGPIEDSAEGTVHFTIPSSPRGVEVRDVRLWFEAGRVVEATAETGQAYLDASLQTDDGARFLGEIGIGTNTGIDRPTGSILFDEKMAGTVHLALGRSYPETGGTNDSALHWDLICDLRDEGRLSIDGQVLNENGGFVG
jgi:aminopeptidase